MKIRKVWAGPLSLNLSLPGALRLIPGVCFWLMPHLSPVCAPRRLLTHQPLPWLTVGCYKTHCCPGCSNPSLAPELARGDAATTASSCNTVTLQRHGRWRVTMLQLLLSFLWYGDTPLSLLPVCGPATSAVASCCTRNLHCRGR